MTKKRKHSSANLNISPMKVEVKEENVLGNDYLLAKGRLHGALRQLTEQSESASDSSDESTGRGYSRRSVNHRLSRTAKFDFVFYH